MSQCHTKGDPLSLPRGRPAATATAAPRAEVKEANRVRSPPCRRGRRSADRREEPMARPPTVSSSTPAAPQDWTIAPSSRTTSPAPETGQRQFAQDVSRHHHRWRGNQWDGACRPSRGAVGQRVRSPPRRRGRRRPSNPTTSPPTISWQTRGADGQTPDGQQQHASGPIKFTMKKESGNKPPFLCRCFGT